MNILFLSSLNPHNINNWSGTLFYLFKSLGINNTVHWFGNNLLDVSKQFHQVQRGYDIPFLPELYAEFIGNNLSISLQKNSKYDLIIARDYFFISHLRTDLPIVYINDTTFDLLKDYLGVNCNYFEKVAEAIEQKAIKNADLLLYSSNWAKNNAINHYGENPDKIEVVEFGANLNTKDIPLHITMTNMDCCNLLFIGKDWEKKGGKKVYQTYLYLKERGIASSLTIIGCNPPHLDATDENLHIIPFIDKSKKEDKELLDKIFRKSHFLVHPTLFDCYGIVFCEASAYGIPSLAADVGGVHQVVINNKNGYLLSSKATSSDYAKKIFQLWKDPQKYQQLRISSRKEFENRLNWKVWGEKVSHLLEKLIEKKQRTMKASKDGNEFYIPTYVINLKEREERKKHIISEFKNKPEFDITFVEACYHPIGAIGLWNSIVKVIKTAIKEDNDVILVCEDDHYFTEHYTKKYLFDNIVLAHEQGADILSGGIGGLGYAVPVSINRYWVDWFWCTQFIVIYKKFYQKILNYQFKDNDTADGVISKLSNNKMTLYPFISRQKEFGYSDITQGNKDNPHLITQHFEHAEAYLSGIHQVSNFYNYPNFYI